MIIALLLFWALVFAALTIRAQATGSRIFIYIVRPLPILILISLVIEAGSGPSPFYLKSLAAGLILSLAGDIFMMVRKKKFKMGLICFFFAHIGYALAFFSVLKPPFSSWPTWPLLLYAVVIVGILFRHFQNMRTPVLLYIVAIITMARAAFEMAVQYPGPGPLAAATGAALFLISDSVLAFDRFLKPVKNAQTVILSTYFAAQAFIALSACL